MRRPIRIGLIGCGNIAVGRHIPAYLGMPDLATVVAVADPTQARRDLALEALGPSDVQPFDDGLALLDDVEIDVLDVCTPPSVRMPVVLAALDRGIPVLCEKPIATVPRLAAELVARAADTGTPLGVIHNYRFLPELVRARRIIDDGDIGEPEVAVLQFLGVEDRPGAAAYRPDWRHQASMAGGGVLMDMIHVIYVAELLLGQPIERVSAQVGVRSPGSAVEELALARYETARGTAIVDIGWGVGPGGYAISGPSGRIEIRNVGGATTPFGPPDELVVTLADGTTRRETFTPDPEEPVPAVYLATAIREFLEAVADGRPAPVDAAAGAHILDVAMATYESAAMGRTVLLPLASSDPVHRLGIDGIRELDLPDWSPVVRSGLFGVGRAVTEG